jgi:glycosyltransferase involved in cell wall biosynthesis
MQLAPSKSDGEFLVSTSRNLFGRGVTPPEVVFWQNVLGEEVERRVDFAINMINDQIAKRDGAADVDLVHDASTCSILGSRRTISKRGWDERRRALSSMTKRSEMGTSMSTPARPTSFEHSGTFKVSMIASLYKGDRFIRPFLENITSLNAFDTAELIIIDANSPENELAVIEEYQALFPNIVYRRINYRISIYEAWNLGVEIARGEYLTNTNLDDVRRSDSIALQAAMLDRNSDVDVVYQDFYYSFEPNLRFEEIAAVGFRSDLPIVTPQNLLLFNSPHNAPMWRARLHEEIGMFDTRYRSAGDHEFWVRCLASRKKFRKINSPHIGYFQNPEGVSTRPNTRGIEEGRDIQTRYCAKLIPSALLQSRRDFRRSLRIGEIDDHLPDNTPYYDVAQAALETLGVRRLSVASSPSRCDDAGADVGREGHVTPCAS